ncbi:hypothetical protein [Actinokineospora iranica]|uniref:hypothetical protein n=1 Tax=Actinokineospora iranica TaxID=1271860 RepID=UPI001113351C|nr:hypothetical protein [Actinokineospora iranica]
MTPPFAPVPAGYPAPPRPPVWWSGLAGAVGLLGAAALAMAGSFGPAFHLTMPAPEGGEPLEIDQTLWTTTTTDPADLGAFLRPLSDYSGIPVAVGAGLLAVAGLLALVATLRAHPRLVTVIRVVGGLGAGVLAGSVAALGINLIGFIDLVLHGPAFEGTSTTVRTETGLTLVIIAAVLAFAATAATWIWRRHRRVEPATPPMGFRAPMAPTFHPTAYPANTAWPLPTATPAPNNPPPVVAAGVGNGSSAVSSTATPNTDASGKPENTDAQESSSTTSTATKEEPANGKQSGESGESGEVPEVTEVSRRLESPAAEEPATTTDGDPDRTQLVPKS